LVAKAGVSDEIANHPVVVTAVTFFAVLTFTSRPCTL